MRDSGSPARPFLPDMLLLVSCCRAFGSGTFSNRVLWKTNLTRSYVSQTNRDDICIRKLSLLSEAQLFEILWELLSLRLSFQCKGVLEYFSLSRGSSDAQPVTR